MDHKYGNYSCHKGFLNLRKNMILQKDNDVDSKHGITDPSNKQMYLSVFGLFVILKQDISTHLGIS